MAQSSVSRLAAGAVVGAGTVAAASTLMGGLNTVSAFEAVQGDPVMRTVKRRPSSFEAKFEGSEEQRKAVQSVAAAANEAGGARLQRRPSWAAKFEGSHPSFAEAHKPAQPRAIEQQVAKRNAAVLQRGQQQRAVNEAIQSNDAARFALELPATGMQQQGYTLKRRPSWAAKFEGSEEHRRATSVAAAAAGDGMIRVGQGLEHFDGKDGSNPPPFVGSAL